jgi:hypothetical protein
MRTEKKRIWVIYQAETGKFARRGFFSEKLVKAFLLKHPGSYLSEHAGEYRVIFKDSEDSASWGYMDLKTFEEAQALIAEKKQQKVKKVFLRQHVIVTCGGKAHYNTKHEADVAADQENAKRPNSASVSVLFESDCPYEILYG